MRYDTPTSLKHLIPYRKGMHLVQEISDKGKMRLKWMDYIAEGNSTLKASRHFDIPESTIRYWKKRYNPYNLKILEDESRRPKNTRKTPVSIEQAQRVIELRMKYQGWGKLKIQLMLRKEKIYIGQNRIQKIINEAGLKRIPNGKKKYVRRKNRRHMYAVPREVLKEPGGLVYLDVKHLRLPGGLKAYQFTAIDHATKMLRMKLFPNMTSQSGKEFFDYLKKKYPFRKIKYIGTDNGSEFLGNMDKELERRKIKHVFSSPRSPKQNPFVERVIRTVIDEVYYYQGLEINREKQQEVLDDYIKVYNEVRPHHSLGLKTPIEKFHELIFNTPNS